MDEVIYKIEAIVRRCGKELLEVKQDKIEIEVKEGIGNFVTQYDKKIQEELYYELTKILPEANFVGEEDELKAEILEEGYTFIIDPIDGTTNFSRDLGMSSISVGLLKNGKPYIGVCYNPYRDEMFMAQKDKGAYLNGNRISVSDKKLNEGIVFTGSAPYYKETREKSIEVLSNFMKVATDFRRFASAVIELCNIACGRGEVFFELKLQPWDYTAGLLIVEEAGGKVTTVEGKEVTFDKPCSILASNNKEDYLKYVKM